MVCKGKIQDEDQSDHFVYVLLKDQVRWFQFSKYSRLHFLAQRSVTLAQHCSGSGSASCACMGVYYFNSIETGSMSDFGQELQQWRDIVLFRHSSSACPTFELTRGWNLKNALYINIYIYMLYAVFHIIKTLNTYRIELNVYVLEPIRPKSPAWRQKPPSWSVPVKHSRH